MRKRNLLVLVGRYGRQQALADAAGLSVQYINQMLSGHRSIGEKTARKIEAALQLALGWMDVDSSIVADTPSDTLKLVADTEVFEVSKDTMRLARAIQSLSADQRAILQALVDSMSQGDGSGSVPPSKKAGAVEDDAVFRPVPSACGEHGASRILNRPSGGRP